MAAVDTAAGLAAFERRGAGTDAERRAARWLAGQVRSPRRDARLETFWCRPNWALAHAWHCLLALAGSLAAVSHPRLGGVLVLVALLSLVCDGLFGHSLGRRLTPERASQNVVSQNVASQNVASQNVVSRPTGPDHGPSPDGAPPPVHLVVTANYDAGRTGLAYRWPWRPGAAALRRRAAGGAATLGWLGWTSIAFLWLVAVAVLRHHGWHGAGVGALQLVATAAVIVELALLLELAGAPFGPAAGDNASGVAVALALVRALDAAPPRHLAVELVLQGAGDGAMVGLRRHLRRRRAQLRPRTTIVLGIGACGEGRPCWWMSDGPLVPLRYAARLRELARRAALATASGPAPGAAAHRDRGVSPALPARARGLPALAVGCRDRRGLAPRSHRPDDVPEALKPAAMDGLLQFSLMLVDELDADLSRSASPPTTGTPAADPRREPLQSDGIRGGEH